MKNLNFIKQKIRVILGGITRLLGNNKVGRIVFEQMVNQCMQKTHTLNYQGLEIKLSVPNQLNYFRSTTISHHSNAIYMKMYVYMYLFSIDIYIQDIQFIHTVTIYI